MGTARNAWARTPYRWVGERLSHRQYQLRAEQPRTDGARALPQDGEDHPRHSADEDSWSGTWKTASDWLGQHLWFNYCSREGIPSAREVGRARSPATPEPSPG